MSPSQLLTWTRVLLLRPEECRYLAVPSMFCIMRMPTLTCVSWQEFMDDYQVVAYDHRGMGDSERPRVRSQSKVLKKQTCN